MTPERRSCLEPGEGLILFLSAVGFCTVLAAFVVSSVYLVFTMKAWLVG